MKELRFCHNGNTRFAVFSLRARGVFRIFPNVGSEHEKNFRIVAYAGSRHSGV